MSQADNDRLKKPVTERDRIQGSIDAPIMLVKYGGYQCPHSGQAYIFVKEIQRRLGNQMCFVFRHFPLIAFHAQAQKAAEAAEVAAAQGKFWEMHDTLFQHQQSLDNGSLVEYAVMLNLDINRFLREMSECVYAEQVHADLRSGVCSGVVSTPTFFINGVRYQQACDLQGLLVAIARASNS